MKNQINTVLEGVCRQGVAEGVCSAVAAGVSIGGQRGAVRARWGFGRTRSDGPGVTVTEETLFDLASLTKPLCTVLVTLALIGQGRLRLEDTLAMVFPGPLSAEKKLLRLWQLLSHSSGMLPYRPYFLEMERKPGYRSTAQLLKQLLEEPLVYPPGSESRYSDLGFILLGHVLEHCTGEPLPVSFRRSDHRAARFDPGSFFPAAGPIPAGGAAVYRGHRGLPLARPGAAGRGT